MGTLIRISCSNCKYEKEYLMGAGQLFFENQDRVKKLINKLSGVSVKEICIESNYNQVFRCFKCNRLYNKVSIIYKVEGTIFFYRIFYECTKCRSPLYPLFSNCVYNQNYIEHNKMGFNINYELDYYRNVMEDIPCYECGMRKLYISGNGVWD